MNGNTIENVATQNTNGIIGNGNLSGSNASLINNNTMIGNQNITTVNANNNTTAYDYSNPQY